MQNVELYDTTLRDGAQHEGISFSVEDKLAITLKLDELGVHYVEGGYPGSNPKDAEFFARARHLRLNDAVVTAFGATRRAGTDVARDANLLALLESGTSVVTLVGKSWDLHVTRVLETSLEENLAMIASSIAFLSSSGRRVFFDAEHFFDGYRADPEYALQTVRLAVEAGAERVILCDTNGGTLPEEIARIVATVARDTDVALGIHTHNDADAAVAGSLAAVRAGVEQVQGAINGYGERCGNANLVSVIAGLKLKMGIDCVSDEQLNGLTSASRYVAEIANMPLAASQPYVGTSAFAHKGGLHVSAVAKLGESYQHVTPETVGNSNRVLVSELSGRSNMLRKVRELGLDVDLTPDQAMRLLEKVKIQESKGFQYEGAEASFRVLAMRTLPDYHPPFRLLDFMNVTEKRQLGTDTVDLSSQAMIKVKVGNEVMHTAADGNGPVNALDNALRKALLRFYPSIEAVRLLDYKVRVVDEGHSTRAVVRVLVESTDGRRVWSTVGASANIIEASWMALSDSMEDWLVRENGTAVE